MLLRYGNALIVVKESAAGGQLNAYHALYAEPAGLITCRLLYAAVRLKRINSGVVGQRPTVFYAANLSAKNIIIWL